MSEPSYPLLPLFRSELQAHLLFELLGSDRALTTPELISATGRPQPSVAREVSRLVDSGLLIEQRLGNTLSFRPDESNPAVRPLRSLVTIALGPQVLLGRALAGVEGVTWAAIFGSFASRVDGIPGGSPRDIDVAIVGSPNRTEVYSVIGEVQDQVGREINVTFLSDERWQRGEERIVQEIRSKPTIELVTS